MKKSINSRTATAIPVAMMLVAAFPVFCTDIWDDEYLRVPTEYPTIQDAIDAAVDGETVMVYPGTYTGEGNKDIEFLGKAITVMSAYGPEYTIIDCEQDGRGFWFHNSENEESIVEGIAILHASRNGGGFYCRNASPTITYCFISGTWCSNPYSDGGGIDCYQASPVITDCLIISNTAGEHGGGIHCYLDSSPFIQDCKISGNSCRSRESHGGGISCISSSPAISNCKISGNSNMEYDSSGGGISCLNSSPTITNCKISGNSTYGRGSGINCINKSFPAITECIVSGNTASRYGGGIYCDDSMPVIRNCTISGNITEKYDGGGIRCNESSPKIINCTISGNIAGRNGGGIYCYKSTPLLSNCIFWGNSPAEIYAVEGNPIVSFSDVQGGWPGEGNIDSDPLFVDPESGDYSLQTGSPCIDAGDPFSRLDKDGTINDMGSSGGSGNLPEGTVGGSVSGTFSLSGSPYIVSEDLLIEKGDSLIVEPGVELLLHNRCSITVYGAFRAEGTEEDTITITAFREQISGGGIRIHEGDVSLNYCRLEKCSNLKGGGIHCAISTLNIRNSSITGNSSQFSGGGVYCDNSFLSLTNCTISGNSASEDGGGFYCYNSSPSITNCIIQNNTAGDDGGGIHCSYSTPTIIGCRISDNSAIDNGGGILCYSSSSSAITNCTISGNTTGDDGGGICCGFKTAIINCAVTGNTADQVGGGIRCGSNTIEDCLISENTTDNYGGGIYCFNQDPTIRNCMISNNLSHGYGGAVYCRSGASPEIILTTISGNTAHKHGGGIYCYKSRPTVAKTSISWNTTSQSGGGIYCYSSSPTFADCSITGNTASSLYFGGGGGIHCNESSPSFANCVISENNSERNGGGFYCSRPSMPTFSGCTISGNSTAGDGGGLYCGRDSTPLITNCTITGNTASHYFFGGGGVFCDDSSPKITNCILWNDWPDEICDYSGAPVVTYTDIQGGWEGEGNIDSEPFFVEEEWGDYRLLWGSPCIDAGTPGFEDPDSTIIDMGAYYYDQSKELTVYLSPEITEIAPGDTGRVNCTVCNPNPYDVAITAAAGLWLPDGTPWPGNPIEGPIFASIPPSSNLTGGYEYPVPPGLLPGTYSVVAGVGLSSRLYDMDRFVFCIVEKHDNAEGFSP